MTHNGLNGRASEPLFRYVRPAFEGLGTNEPVDFRVRDELISIGKLLAKGFHDVDDAGNQQQYKTLKEKLAWLENEEKNGINAAIRQEEAASNELGELTKRWGTVQMELMGLKEQVAQYKPQPKPGADEDPLDLKAYKKALETKRREATAASTNVINARTTRQLAEQRHESLRARIEADLVEVKRKLEKQNTGKKEDVTGKSTTTGNADKEQPSDKTGTLEEQLRRLEDEDKNGINAANKEVEAAIKGVGTAERKQTQVQAELATAQEKVDKYKRPHQPRQDDPALLELARKLADKEDEANDVRNRQLDAETNLRNAHQAYETTYEGVRLDQEEVREQLSELRRQQMPDDYGNRFDLYKLTRDDVAVGRTSFSRKIGGDSLLQGLFVVVEDRIDKGRLSFNVSLFFAETDLLRLAFLRAYYLDGLRDADAIAERVVDEKDGGAKHIYDFIVEKVVLRVVKDRKLN